MNQDEKACPYCGEEIKAAAKKCRHCGEFLDERLRRPVSSPQEDLGQNAGMRLVLPVGRSVWAILAGYLGLGSLLFCPAPFALITGVIAVLDIQKNPKKHGLGRAYFGIVMGLLGCVAMVAFAVTR